MIINNKRNPKWVRERYGKYWYEYQENGEYFGRGYFKTAEEAHAACLKAKEEYKK